MANKKISQLTDGTNVTGVDEFVINRGLVNFGVTGDYIKTFTNAPLIASITANTTQIATNVTNIATVTSLAASNFGDITTLQATSITHTTDIAANLAAIGINASGIATNVTGIGVNTGNITTNTTNIATNTASIAINTANIGINTAAIATNAVNITAVTANVTTNATNIATNVTNIAANVTNISTNTAAIAALYRIIRVENEAEFIAAFTTLAATGGAIVLDGTIDLTAPATINCDDIQVWGMLNKINFAEQTGATTFTINKLTLTGANAFFRDVSFQGCSDFNIASLSSPYVGWGSEYTTTLFDINDNGFGYLSFVDCTWVDVIANENAGVTDEPIINYLDAADWTSTKFERNNYATRHSSGTPKPYGGFRIGRRDTYDGWRVVFFDLSCLSLAGTIGLSNTYDSSWAQSFNAGQQCFITDTFHGHANTDVQREFVTDGTVTFDEDRSYYEDLGGTKQSPFLWNIVAPKNQSMHWTDAADPTSTSTFGKPGDTYKDTDTNRIYLKIDTIRKDTRWEELKTGYSAETELKRSVTLSAGEVATISSIPVIVVPAPPIGSIIVPTQAICEIDYSGAAVVTADETFELQVATATHPCIYLEGMIIQNTDVIMVAAANSAPSLGDTVLRIGRPLNIIAGSNPTSVLGVTSTWKITVWYKIVTP